MRASSGKRVTELTVRGLILGVAITLVFTAANVYLGLKVGLTFATSIPAAVISMAVLSLFKDSSILENNIVQTVASAAGTLSAIIFVLPGLVIVGWWTGFPFWTSFWICAAGGVLGVLFTIPLRRAMVTHSDLPYPEGVAAAQVLEVGDAARQSEDGDTATKEGLMAVIWGTLAAILMSLVTATRVAAGEVATYFKVGTKAVSGVNPSFSMALLGVGYLVGISVGMAMLLGLVLSWVGAVPILSAMSPDTGLSAHDLAISVWSDKVRFIGAGTIGIAAIWTLTKLVKPVVGGIIGTLKAAKKNTGADTRDVDMPPLMIAGIGIICLAIIGVLLEQFLSPSVLASQSVSLIATALPFIFLGGFLIAAITGYMAGLIGASNSPISGVGILAIIICAGLFYAVAVPSDAAKPTLVAYALFATAVVFAIATISNNNLQDLKTGQLVGATPRAQQWALIIGVLAGSVVIPPVLNLLGQAYGFAGAPHVATAVAQPLPAPQASLIAALAQGVIEQKLDWDMIGLGAGIGVILVIVDELLGRAKLLRLPPLAVGIGIYLPMSATLPVVIGAVLGYIFDRWADKRQDPERAKRLMVLVSSGLIVGESLFGVLLAGLIVTTSSDAPLGLVGAHFVAAPYISVVIYVAIIVSLFRWIRRKCLQA